MTKFNRKCLHLILRFSFGLKEAEKEGSSMPVEVVCRSTLSESVVVVGKKDDNEGDDQEQEAEEEGPGVTATAIRVGTEF